jgi:hypothetical protein
MKRLLTPLFILSIALPKLSAVVVATPEMGVDYDSAPPLGEPWNNVLNTASTTGTSIYLGGGWILTANHVFVGGPSSTSSGVVYEGTTFNADPGQIYELNNPPVPGGNPDLRLYRLEQQLGLPTLDLGGPVIGTPVTMIGYGGGKSWGRNTVESTPVIVSAAGRSSVTFSTDYDTSTPGEGQAITGDSGGGVFYQTPGGDWVLGGVMLAVGDLLGEESTFSADMGTYGSEIETIILTNGSAPVPEPSVTFLAGFAGLALLRRNRRPSHR